MIWVVFLWCTIMFIFEHHITFYSYCSISDDPPPNHPHVSQHCQQPVCRCLVEILIIVTKPLTIGTSTKHNDRDCGLRVNMKNIYSVQTWRTETDRFYHQHMQTTLKLNHFQNYFSISLFYIL